MPLFSDKTDTHESADTHYIIHKENINNEYFWFYVKYGDRFPHSPTVFNYKNKQEENNPRTNDQIETNKQFFLLYSTKNTTLYLSQANKKTMFEKYLNGKLKQNVTIKTFFKSVEDFIKQVRSIQKVKFVAKNDLFNKDIFNRYSEIMKLFPNPIDMYGLGMPESFSLEANFKNKHPTDDFVSLLKKMVGWKNSHNANSLVCIGLDDKNFETIFNADSFMQKIPVLVNINDEGMYEPESVKKALISKIKSDINE